MEGGTENGYTLNEQVNVDKWECHLTQVDLFVSSVRHFGQDKRSVSGSRHRNVCNIL